MEKKGRRIFLVTGLLTAFLLFLTIPVQATSTVFISDFYVTPTQAAVGAKVTAGVTIRNLDNSNPVSLTITISDSGVVVAQSKQPLAIPAGGSGSTTLQFRTSTNGPHCYLATTSPQTYSVGYCEVGNLLGGTALSSLGPVIALPYLVAGAFATVGIVVLASRRAKKN